MTPQISVLVTSHNSDQLLVSALDSIYRQTINAAEVLIVDAGSELPTETLLSSYPHKQRVFRESLGGLGAALNFGIAHAKHDLIAPLDHDDYWPNDKLEWQRRLLIKEGADVVVGSVVNEWLYPTGKTRRDFMGIARLLGSCLIHKRAFEIVGPFEEGSQIHEIIEWWSRAGSRLKVVTDPRVALYRRIHGKNMTLNTGERKRADLIARVRTHIQQQDPHAR